MERHSASPCLNFKAHEGAYAGCQECTAESGPVRANPLGKPSIRAGWQKPSRHPLRPPLRQDTFWSWGQGGQPRGAQVLGSIYYIRCTMYYIPLSYTACTTMNHSSSPRAEVHVLYVASRDATVWADYHACHAVPVWPKWWWPRM
eukprot:16388968-Heterocapsa_arctica.AAC.1